MGGWNRDRCVDLRQDSGLSIPVVVLRIGSAARGDSRFLLEGTLHTGRAHILGKSHAIGTVN